MKKWLTGILLIVIIGSVLGIYLMIPPKFVVLRATKVQVKANGAFRVLSNNLKWKKWWRNEAGQGPGKGDSLLYNGYLFRVTDYETNVIGVEISKGSLRLNSIMTLLNINQDSTVIVWKTDTLPSGIDPITRIVRFNKAAEISECMKGILLNLNPYISNLQNVYDLSIYWTVQRDSSMLSAKFKSATYPSTAELYGYFDVLKKSIRKQHGTPINFPLMNVVKLGNDSFETEVAVPTNRKLKSDGKIVSMKMVPAKFIGANVTGGIYTTNEALRQLEFFVADFGKWKVANPFQVLVTDRTQEPDTSKWITRIYIPVVP